VLGARSDRLICLMVTLQISVASHSQKVLYRQCIIQIVFEDMIIFVLHCKNLTVQCLGQNVTVNDLKDNY
jgi:hypothetical protein